MALQDEKVSGRVTCLVEATPRVVDAGAELTLQGKVSSFPPCDLQGHTLSVKDQTGAEAGTIELAEFDGEANQTGTLVVKAPAKAGRYGWSVVCPAVDKNGTLYDETSAPIAVVVKPHATRIAMWDIPSAIAIGDKFAMKVGIKCSSECDLTNGTFDIYDHNEARLATGTLSGERWPGTAGLYFEEVELEAPAEKGLYNWSIKCPNTDAGLPHIGGVVHFGVRVVGRPECLVTVEAVDKANQTPLEGARVVMHPYKAVTDERGIAQIRVTKGSYKLFVSQSKYLTFDRPVEVTADVSAKAELDLEPPIERD